MTNKITQQFAIWWKRQQDAGNDAPTYEETFQAGWQARDAEVAEWQPISTAPKDGRRVLLYQHHYQSIAGEDIYTMDAGHFDGVWVTAEFDSGDSSGVNTIKPTHWMPLPQPPHKQEG